MKVVPQAAACREIEVGGRIYSRKAGALFDLPEAAARHVIKYQGGQTPSLSGSTRSGIGFKCLNCGFGSFFKSCSRCGGECARDAE